MAPGPILTMGTDVPPGLVGNQQLSLSLTLVTQATILTGREELPETDPGLDRTPDVRPAPRPSQRDRRPPRQRGRPSRRIAAARGRSPGGGGGHRGPGRHLDRADSRRGRIGGPDTETIRGDRADA